MKDIIGYENLYAVTEDGQVWSYKSKKFLKPFDNGHGYLYVSLLKNNQRKNCRVHRLVAEAFLPNPNNKPQVDHINRNRRQNNVSNLEWVSSSENNKRSRKKGLSKPVTEVLCVETGIIYKSQTEAARAIGIHPYGISNVLNGKQKTAGGYHWTRVEESNKC